MLIKDIETVKAVIDIMNSFDADNALLKTLNKN